MSSETMKNGKISDYEIGSPRATVRDLSDGAWIDRHASGTLRKAKSIDFSWRSMYLEERTAYEWGWGFVIVPKSRVIFGDPIIESDCRPLTEACWHIERYLTLNPFPDSDKLEAKYIKVESKHEKKEGIGMVLRHTSADWIPEGHIVYAIIAEYDPRTHNFLPARNPF